MSDLAIDVLGVIPVVVGHRLEAADAAAIEAPLEAAGATGLALECDDVFDDLPRGEALLRGVGEDGEVFVCASTQHPSGRLVIRPRSK